MMETNTTKKKSKKKIVLIIVVAVLVIILGVSAGYLAGYYKADDEAIGMSYGVGVDQSVEVFEKDDMLIFVPKNPVVGLVFYQGGKVQCEAYAPLMAQLAAEGILCVLPRLTANLAFLESNAASDALALYPEIKNWYIGGHSLGGVAASSYAAKNSDKLEGIIFLASYPSADLSGTDLRALSIYGDQDGVLNMEAYEKAADKWPADFTEIIIPGGNHANFGNYGDQDGDGFSTITQEEQQAKTVEAIVEFVK